MKLSDKAGELDGVSSLFPWASIIEIFALSYFIL